MPTEDVARPNGTDLGVRGWVVAVSRWLSWAPRLDHIKLSTWRDRRCARQTVTREVRLSDRRSVFGTVTKALLQSVFKIARMLP